MVGIHAYCKYTAMNSDMVTGQMVYYKCSDHREKQYGHSYRTPENPCGAEGKYYVEKEKRLSMIIMLWELLKYKLRKSHDNMRKRKTGDNT
jgi:hypothetical protein